MSIEKTLDIEKNSCSTQIRVPSSILYDIMIQINLKE